MKCAWKFLTLAFCLSTSYLTAQVIYYPFDVDGTDSSGGNNTGTLIGDATINTTGGFAKVGNGALSLSGSGRVSVNGGSSFNLGSNYTVSAWINPTNTNNIESILSSAGAGGLQNGFNFYVNTYPTGDGALVLETGNGSAGQSVRTSSGAISFTGYQFVTLTVSGTTVNFYVNGASVSSSGGVQSDYSTNLPLQIGQFAIDNSFGYTGAIDDFKIYNTTLNSAQVLAAYQAVPEPSTYWSVIVGLAFLLTILAFRQQPQYKS